MSYLGQLHPLLVLPRRLSLLADDVVVVELVFVVLSSRLVWRHTLNMCDVIGPISSGYVFPFTQWESWDQLFLFNNFHLSERNNSNKSRLGIFLPRRERNIHLLLNRTRITELVGVRSPDWASRPRLPIYLLGTKFTTSNSSLHSTSFSNQPMQWSILHSNKLTKCSTIYKCKFEQVYLSALPFGKNVLR